MEIKKKLEEMRSPLHIDLMHFLKELVKDYKNEVCFIKKARTFYISRSFIVKLISV